MVRMERRESRKENGESQEGRSKRLKSGNCERKKCVERT